MTLTLNPTKVKIKNIYNNQSSAKKELVENFIKILFCPEDLYENFIVPKGKSIKNKTKYDDIFEEHSELLIPIGKIFEFYKKKMKEIKEDPFPIDSYEFQIKFFNVLVKNSFPLKSLNYLVKDKKYLKDFIDKMRNTYKNLRDVFFHEENTRSKLINIFDKIMIELEMSI